MAEAADIVVVGAGVMGCGTAYWLSKAGYGVLMLEQEAIACGASGMYMVAGHFRSGMLLSAISTRLIADLIMTGQSPLPIAAFDPGRFGTLAG